MDEHAFGDSKTYNSVTTIDRRTVMRGAAWSVPVIATAVGAPAAAASVPTQTISLAEEIIPGLAGVANTALFRVMLGGIPVASQDVSFLVSSGYATLASPSGVTDSNGYVEVSFTPQQAGGTLVIQASTGGGLGLATALTLPPRISVSPSLISDPSAATTFTVVGEGFVDVSVHPATTTGTLNDGNGVYVVILPKSTWSGDAPLSAETVSGGQAWVPKAFPVGGAQVSNGNFTVSLTVPGGQFDPEVEYHVGTSAAHGLSAYVRSLDSFADLVIA